MKEIITALLIWLGANSDFNVNMDIPVVLFLPQDQMEQRYFGDTENHGELHGFYDIEKNIIILPNTWDRRDPWDLSVLLHEMIHYVQDQNETEFNCTAEMEKDSWPLQQKYLLEIHNFKWDYDKLWYLMVSSCSDPFNY
tara:strand:- start:85 stop:501 length:417 start_codon:yes stop_codon:yes gene_type:complete